MGWFKNQYKTIGVIGSCFVCVNTLTAQGLESVLNDYENRLNFYINQDIEMGNAMNDRSEDVIDGDDRRTIEKYYAQVRASYLTPGIKQLTEINLDGILNEYKSSLLQLSIKPNPPKISEDSARSFNSCLSSAKGSMDDHRDRSLSAFSRIQKLHKQELRFSSSMSHLEDYDREKRDLMNSLRAMKIKSSKINECCSNNFIENCEDKIQILNNAEATLAAAFKLPDQIQVLAPNPLGLDSKDLTAHDIRLIIEEKGTTLRQLRGGANSVEHLDESDVFESMANCRKRAAYFQDNTLPTKQIAVNSVGKLLKCSVLPMVATQNWDSDKAMIVNTLADAEIKGHKLDLTCDPGTGKMWQTIQDQGRDPTAWGIPQMANPPYLQSLRTVPPVSTGVNGITDAQDYMNLYPMPGVENYNVASNAARTVGSVANSQSGIQLGGRTLSLKVSPSGATATRRGQELALAVRESSSNIRNDNQAEYYATRLARGAQSTRKFLENGVSRSSKISTPKALERQKQDASRARDTVLRSVGTTASRSTSQGILNGLRNVQNTAMRAVDSVGEQNRKVKDAVKGQIQGILNNIDLARVKAEEARASIMKMVATYDQKVAELTQEIDGKAPKKIGALIQAKRTELFELVKTMGTKKAEFDGLQAQILEQNSALMRIASFGPQGTDLATSGSRGSLNTPTNVNGVDTSGMPQGRGTLQSNTGYFEKRPLSGFEKFMEFMNPFPDAFAVGVKAQEEFERFWNSEWKRFVSQYGDYVESRQKVEKNIANEAAKLVAVRNRSVTEENYDFIDQRTLLTADLYISELEEESEFLIQGQKSGQIRMQQPVLSRILETRQDTLKAREAWIAAQNEHLKIIPKSYEDDPELWWGFVPQIFIE